MAIPQSKPFTIEQILNPQGSIYSAAPSPTRTPPPSQPFTIAQILNPTSCCPGLAKPAGDTKDAVSVAAHAPTAPSIAYSTA